ncbi:MAG: type 4a pilus biogenesis protein PilO [Candidatus Omnitrophica bacterium]|nr:type 4a pilus biogenesis protein PilO [Candidatus Omnitrophota bacterium]
MATKSDRSKREQQLLLGMFLLMGVGGWVYIAYAVKPLLSRLSTVSQEVSSAETQLKQVEQVVAEIPRLQQEHDKLVTSIKTLREGLPSEERLPAIIEFLSDLASQTGVKIQTIFPQRSFEALGVSSDAPPSKVTNIVLPKTPDLYRGIPIQIDALAGFHQLGTFLSRVEAGNQPVQLRSLRISGNPREFRRHNVKLVLLVYFESEPKTAAAPMPGRAQGGS